MHSPEKTQDSFMSLARLSGESIFCMGRTLSPVWKGLFFLFPLWKGLILQMIKLQWKIKKGTVDAALEASRR